MKNFIHLHTVQLLKSLLCCFLLTALAACQSNESKIGGLFKLQTNLNLTISAGSKLNPDEARNASPLFIRLYELSSDELIQSSNFIDLYERDSEVLADQLIQKQELDPVLPGTSRTEKITLSKTTQYVALYAEFFDYEDAQYMLVFPVTKNNVFRDRVNVQIDENRLRLAQDL